MTDETTDSDDTCTECGLEHNEASPWRSWVEERGGEFYPPMDETDG